MTPTFCKQLRNVTTLGLKRIRRKYVDYFTENGIAIVSLNHPEKRNPIDIQCLEELSYVLGTLTEKWDLRSVLIKSAVAGTFSTGMELEAYATWSDEEVAYVGLKTREMLTKLMKFPIPTIALIEGAAIGSGAELALSCDFRIGNENAVFSFPETRLGLIPMTALERLPLIVGLSKAKKWIFTGKKIESSEALKNGLLDLKTDDVESIGKSFAQEMADCAPLALRAAKMAIENEEHEDITNLFRMLIARDDRREGVHALIDKRRPKYEGR